MVNGTDKARPSFDMPQAPQIFATHKLQVQPTDPISWWCITAWRMVRNAPSDQGRFAWPSDGAPLQQPALTQAQFEALIVGLPWHRLAHMEQ